MLRGDRAGANQLHCLTLPQSMEYISHIFWVEFSISPGLDLVLFLGIGKPQGYQWHILGCRIPFLEQNIYLVLYNNPVATQPSHRWTRRLG